jgi:hypothetical protein
LLSRSSDSNAAHFNRNLFPQHRNNAVARDQHDLTDQLKLEERSMQFESQWPGDAIAAPFWPTGDREEGFFEGPGGKSWNRVDDRVDQADADPTAAVQRRIRRTEPVRLLSKPNPRGRWVAAVMSLVIDHVIEGFALSATTLHPEFFLLANEQARRERETGKRRPAPRSDPIHPSYAGQARAAPSRALRPREAMSLAGAHGSSR